MQRKAQSDGREHDRIWRAVRHVKWPINEILLQDLIMKNLSDKEIAILFGVSADDVTMLRETYGQ